MIHPTKAQKENLSEKYSDLSKFGIKNCKISKLNRNFNEILMKFIKRILETQFLIDFLISKLPFYSLYYINFWCILFLSSS